MEQAGHRGGFDVRKRLSFIARQDVKTSETDVEEQLADGDDLLKCFSPLFNSMRLFGLYFTRASRRIHNASTSSTVTTDRAVRRKWNAGRIYAVVIMVIAWLNVTRMMTVFDRTDRFGFVLFLKLASSSFTLLCAVLQTACFVGCQSGNLDRVFRDAKLPQSDVIRYRRLAIIHTAVIWIVLMAEMVVVLVPTITAEKELPAFMMPFGVYVYVSNELYPLVKVVMTLLFVFADFTWLFSHSVNYILQGLTLY